jgi:hypothetical protein
MAWRKRPLVSNKSTLVVKVELMYLDRYVALDVAARRVAIFPDLLVTFGIKGTPLYGRELSRGQHVHILVIPNEQLTPQMATRLGAIHCELKYITGKSMCLPPAAESTLASSRGKEVMPIDLS